MDNVQAARKQRRLSGRTQDRVQEQQFVEQEQDDFADDKAFVNDAMKDDPKLAKILKANVKNYQKQKRTAENLPLRRGIRSLDTTPDTLMQTSLARMTGKDETIFLNWTSRNVRHSFWYAMGGVPTMKVKKGMTPTEWDEWVSDFYTQNGRKLDGFDFDSEPDWECKDGEYSMACDAGTEDDDDPLVTALYDNSTMKTAKMPPGFDNIRESELSTVWIIESNFSKTEAHVKNIQTRACFFCCTLFAKD